MTETPGSKGFVSVLVLFSLFFVFILPVWYATSRVYRAVLPELDSINFVGDIEIPVRIVYGTQPSRAVVDAITRELSTALQSQKKFKYILHSTVATGISSTLSSLSPQTVDERLHEYYHAQAIPSSLTFFLLPTTTPTTPPTTTTTPVWTMGQYFHGWLFLPPQELSAAVVVPSLHKLIMHVTHMQGSSRHESVLLQSLNHHRLSFSLLNAKPSAGEWYSWRIEEAINTYLTPFINKLSPIFTTTVDSQVLHYADITETLQSSSSIQKHETGKYHLIESSVLRTFVGNTKWNRESPLVKSSIEILVYIPSPEHRPLYIRQEGELSSSFLVPRWGGVVIHNDLSTNSTTTSAVPHIITAEGLQGVAEAVLSQIRIMLELSPTHEQNKDVGVFLPNTVAGVTEWELQCLMRSSVLKNVEKVEDTLRSLSQLLDSVTKMPVEDYVASRVHTAVENLRKAHKSINEETYAASMSYSRQAVDGAENAFFHPSMLPALYFPDEHLYAVYAPFFFPTVLPVAGAVLTRIKMWRKKRGELGR